MTLMLLVVALSVHANNGEKAAKKAALQFARAADEADGTKLQRLLHEQFRVVINQFGEKKETTVWDKTAYLGLIRDGVIGGTSRTTSIEEVTVLEHIAYVRMRSESAKARFTSLLIMTKDLEGNWQVLSDAPYVEFLSN